MTTSVASHLDRRYTLPSLHLIVVFYFEQHKVNIYTIRFIMKHVTCSVHYTCPAVIQDAYEIVYSYHQLLGLINQCAT